MRQLFCIFLSLLFLQSTAVAQSLEQYISKDALVVMKVDPQRIGQKVNFEDIKKMDFFESMMEGITGDMDKETGSVISEALKSPGAYGMNLNVPYYVTFESDQKNSKVSFLMNLSNNEQFEKLLKDQMREIESAKFLENNNVKSWQVDGGAISWKGNVAQIIGINVERDSTDHATDDAFHTAKRDFLKTALTEGYRTKISQSILSHSNYKLSAAHPHDINVWMDYGYISSLSSNEGMESLAMMGMGGYAEKMAALNEDAYLLMGTDFENGKMDIDSKMYMGKDMAKIYQKSTERVFNKRMARYIPKENLMGFFSMGLNIEGMVSALKELFDPKNESMPFMEGMAVGALQGMGVDMTANEVYQLFPGDMIMAVTGMKKFTGKTMTTDYDEDFNPIEIEKEVTQELPLVTMMMSYTDDENLKQILDLAKNALGFEQGNGFMSMAVPNMPMKMYMAHEKGVFIVSNDENLIQKKRKKGFSRGKRMSKSQCKMLLEKASVFFWDVPKTVDVVKGMDVPMPGVDGLLRTTKETFSNFTMTMDKVKGDVMDSKMSLNFEDKNKNSLTQFFNFVNEMYLTGGQSL